MSAQTDSRPVRDVLPRPGPRDAAGDGSLGTELALTDYDGTMDWMDEVVAARHRACVSAAAVHLVMVAQGGPRDAPCRRRTR